MSPSVSQPLCFRLRGVKWALSHSDMLYNGMRRKGHYRHSSFAREVLFHDGCLPVPAAAATTSLYTEVGPPQSASLAGPQGSEQGLETPRAHSYIPSFTPTGHSKSGDGTKMNNHKSTCCLQCGR